METRPAVTGDIPRIMHLIDRAREIMRSDGNMHQWNDGYPSVEAIEKDIRLGHGFSYCGLIYLESGAERLAYQLILDKKESLR